MNHLLTASGSKKLKMSIQLDTGMATLEIEMAVKVIEAEGNKKSLSIIVHLVIQRVWKVLI